MKSHASNEQTSYPEGAPKVKVSPKFASPSTAEIAAVKVEELATPEAVVANSRDQDSMKEVVTSKALSMMQPQNASAAAALLKEETFATF